MFGLEGVMLRRKVTAVTRGADASLVNDATRLTACSQKPARDVGPARAERDASSCDAHVVQAPRGPSVMRHRATHTR
jgi:hypothetical protein